MPEGYSWKLSDILPKVLTAGEEAGSLTEEGAALLDESGMLQAGVPFCPPEGDAGTGMTATNSVAVRTGNVSAGTSVFAKSGSETYTYDLNSSGTYEVFPLSEGNGSYQVKVFENIQGTQYSQAFSQSLDVHSLDLTYHGFQHFYLHPDISPYKSALLL